MLKTNAKSNQIKVRDEGGKDFKYSVQLMRQLFGIVGLWPFYSIPYTKTVRSLIIGTIYSLFAFFFIPYCMNIFLIVKSFKTRLRMFGPLSFGMTNITKYATILIKEKMFCECVNWIADDWKKIRSTTERNIMIEYARIARYLAASSTLFMIMSGMSYTAIFTFTQKPVIVNNVTIRASAYPSYFVIFDGNVSPTFEIVYAIHCLCGFSQYTITVAVISAVVIFSMHCCGQFEVISWMIEELGTNHTTKKLETIVRRHLRAINFAVKIEKVLTEICMVEMVGCTFSICMLGFYLITEFKINNLGPYSYILLLISFTFNIFIFCYIGDRLTSHCDNIGHVAYQVQWYNLSAKDARNLILIIAATQHPVVLTAGKMAILSIPNFGRVLKASFSYLNMLRTITMNTK